MTDQESDRSRSEVNNEDEEEVNPNSFRVDCSCCFYISCLMLSQMEEMVLF